MPFYSTIELFDLSQTIAKSLFEKNRWPWQALEHIGDFITNLGPTLPTGEYTHIDTHIWVSKTATVAASASITGPCIIGHHADIRHCAFIRGNALIGENTVVGNSTELKNCILFNNVQVPHFNYIGDSILGYKSHMGAGAVTSNVKSDKTLVVIKSENSEQPTNRKKVGAILGDNVEVGCNSVLNPGTIIGQNCSVYPTSCVRGVVPENSIWKNNGTIIKKSLV